MIKRPSNRVLLILLLACVCLGLYIFFPPETAVVPSQEYPSIPRLEETEDSTIADHDPGFTIVTMFSNNHAKEAILLCQSFSKLNETKTWKKGVMRAYIHPDVDRKYVELYKTLCPRVETRDFDLPRYPKDVTANLEEYMWKPVLIDDVLQENITQLFWFDSSVRMAESNDSFKKIVDSMSEFPCGFRSFSPAKHTIGYAVNPLTLQYLNMSKADADRFQEFEANLFFVKKTPLSTSIMKKFVDCAKTRACMAPPHSITDCAYKHAKKDDVCHRYDQAVINILMYLHCSDDWNKFYRPSKMLSIKRIEEKMIKSLWNRLIYKLYY